MRYINTEVEGVTDDTGWVEQERRGSRQEWVRSMRTTQAGQEIAEILRKRGDRPGWCSMYACEDEGGVVTLVSHSDWDSRD